MGWGWGGGRGRGGEEASWAEWFEPREAAGQGDLLDEVFDVFFKVKDARLRDARDATQLLVDSLARVPRVAERGRDLGLLRLRLREAEDAYLEG